MNISSISNSPSPYYQNQNTHNHPEEEIKDASLQEKSPLQEAKDNENDPEYRQKIEELKSIEREVIAHEMAHKSVGGQYASSASFTYTMGPDGKRYKTGGEVAIQVPTGGDLEKTEQALERVKQAALAPAKPSGQDLRAAANASATQQRIRAELSRQKVAEIYEKQMGGKDKNQQKGQLDIAI